MPRIQNELKFGLNFSADDHVQEHPQVWTARMSRKGGATGFLMSHEWADGSDCWIVDGQPVSFNGRRSGQRGNGRPWRGPKRWDDVASDGI